MKGLARIITIAAALFCVACGQSDESITASVKTKFAADPAVKASQIDVTTQDRVVTLKGSVDTLAAKDQALRLTRETGGVRNVVDNLQIRAASTAGAALESAAQTSGAAVSDAAKATGNAVSDAAKTTGNAVASGAQDAGTAASAPAKESGNVVTNAANATGDAVVTGAKATGEATVKGAEVAGSATVKGAEAAGSATVKGAEATASGAKKLGSSITGAVTGGDDKKK